ncbi:hypothetical protein [Terriglobus albidus]|uniref:hypothetical protein n=1 Tax=Terriglobus albidus TaxID=1592106 RepID=UPI0021E08336|nr:hypothetical protein [Terriglobus albidus]
MKPRGDIVAGVPGAEIRRVPTLPETLDGAVQCGGWSIARPGALVHTVPGVARFRITNGDLIEVAWDEGADPIAVDQYLTGAARATLVHQRGGVPLHAACLTPPAAGYAVAVAGHSGAGKSTLAAELVRRGWSLLGDDVTPLYVERTQVMAWPSKAGLKLWRDACERLDIDTGTLNPLPGERDKYLFPIETAGGPLPLRAVFLLERGIPQCVLPVRGPERLALVTANTYKPNYLKALGCQEGHLRTVAQISSTAEIFILRSDSSVYDRATLLIDTVGRRIAASISQETTTDEP